MTAPEISPRWSVGAALTAIIVGAFMIVGGFFVVVRGLENDWPRFGRAVAFVALFEGLGMVLAGLHRFVAIGAWVADQGRSFERFALISPLVLSAGVAVPMFIASAFGIEPARAMFAAVGVGSIALAVWRPWWFWFQPEV